MLKQRLMWVGDVSSELLVPILHSPLYGRSVSSAHLWIGTFRGVDSAANQWRIRLGSIDGFGDIIHAPYAPLQTSLLDMASNRWHDMATLAGVPANETSIIHFEKIGTPSDLAGVSIRFELEE